MRGASIRPADNASVISPRHDPDSDCPQSYPAVQRGKTEGRCSPVQLKHPPLPLCQHSAGPALAPMASCRRQSFHFALVQSHGGIVAGGARNVGSAPESCHESDPLACPLRARSRQSALQQKTHYSITSSASASNFAGNSTPIALAALRLSTNCNFVGRCTGRSVGFAPFKISPV